MRMAATSRPASMMHYELQAFPLCSERLRALRFRRGQGGLELQALLLRRGLLAAQLHAARLGFRLLHLPRGGRRYAGILVEGSRSAFAERGGDCKRVFGRFGGILMVFTGVLLEIFEIQYSIISTLASCVFLLDCVFCARGVLRARVAERHGLVRPLPPLRAGHARELRGARGDASATEVRQLGCEHLSHRLLAATL